MRRRPSRIALAAAATAAACAGSPADAAGQRTSPVAGGVARVADPAGGARWSVQARRTEGGQLCAYLRRRGRALDRECSPLHSNWHLRVRVAQGRTVVYGLVRPWVGRIELASRPRTRVRITRRGRAVIAVVRGVVDPADVGLLIRGVTGEEVREPWEEYGDWASDTDLVPSWRVTAVKQATGVTGRRWCARAIDHRPRDGPRTAMRFCGRVGARRVRVRVRRVAGRTLVLGLAGAAVADVIVTTPDGGFDAELTGWGRGVLRVLPRDVDPATAQVRPVFHRPV